VAQLRYKKNVHCVYTTVFHYESESMNPVFNGTID